MILSKYRVQLRDLILGESNDETGESWVVHNLEGWQNTSSTGQTTQRVGQRGGWRNRADLASKGFTLSGAVYTDGVTLAGDALDKLLDAIPIDVPEPMTVYGVHANSDRLVFVRQEGEAVTQIVSDTEAVFSIGLVALDPIKYGTTQHNAGTSLPSSTGGLVVPHRVPFSVNSVTVSGVINAENVGNVSVFPRMVVYGPLPDARITHVNSGKVLTLSLTLGADEWLDLDFDRHTAYLNGTASRRGYVSGSWFALEPGVNFIAFNSSTYSADASLQVLWSDGWK